MWKGGDELDSECFDWDDLKFYNKIKKNRTIRYLRALGLRKSEFLKTNTEYKAIKDISTIKRFLNRTDWFFDGLHFNRSKLKKKIKKKLFIIKRTNIRRNKTRIKFFSWK